MFYKSNIDKENKVISSLKNANSEIIKKNASFNTSNNLSKKYKLFSTLHKSNQNTYSNSEYMIALSENRSNQIGFAAFSIQNAKLILGQITDNILYDNIIQILFKFKPIELYIPEYQKEFYLSKKIWDNFPIIKINYLKSFYFDESKGLQIFNSINSNLTVFPPNDSYYLAYSCLNALSKQFFIEDKLFLINGTMINIEIHESDKYVHIDWHTLINSEILFNIDDNKKNNSLFSIFKCHTNGGYKMLRSNLIQPLFDQKEIKFRHNLIEIFLNNDNLYNLLDKFLPKFKNIDNISIKFIQKPIDYTEEMIKLYISYIIELKSYLENYLELYTIYFQLNLKNIDDFILLIFKKKFKKISTNLLEQINNLVISDKNIKIDKNNFVKYLRFENKINLSLAYMSHSRIEYCFNDYFNKLYNLSKKNNINLKQVNIKEIILIKIKIDENYIGKIQNFIYFIEKNLSIDIINYQQKKNFLLIETNDLHVLNNQLQEIKSLILIMVFEEINNLINEIQKFNEFLTLISFNFSYLDMLLSFTKLVKLKNFKKPIIDNKFNNFFIENFVNPLFLNKKEDYNNKYLINKFISYDYQNINYLIGDNFSGKTVFLKSILYIVILFHIGSYVPCYNLILKPFKLIVIKFCYNIDKEVKGSGLEKELLRIKDIFINLNYENSHKNNLILIDNLISSSSNEDIYQLSLIILKNLWKFDNLKCIITSRDYKLFKNNLKVSLNYMNNFKIKKDYDEQKDYKSIKLYETLSSYISENKLFFNILKENDKIIKKSPIEKEKEEISIEEEKLNIFFKKYINIVLNNKNIDSTDFDEKYLEIKNELFN